MIEYEVVYSNRKSIRITVERDRRVVVRAPDIATGNAVATAVRRKQLWIWQKISDEYKYPDPSPRKEFVSGETFLFLGQNYGLTLTRDQGSAISLVGKQFIMPNCDREEAYRRFRSWYLAQAKEKITPRIATFAAEIGVAYKRICVRDLKYRWSSCTPAGTLSFNWRVVQAPMIVIDYLVVHELAHIVEANHSQEFWNIVAVHSPTWKKARRWLKQNGSRLEW